MCLVCRVPHVPHLLGCPGKPPVPCELWALQRQGVKYLFYIQNLRPSGPIFFFLRPFFANGRALFGVNLPLFSSLCARGHQPHISPSRAQAVRRAVWTLSAGFRTPRAFLHATTAAPPSLRRAGTPGVSGPAAPSRARGPGRVACHRGVTAGLGGWVRAAGGLSGCFPHGFLRRARARSRA